MGVIQHTRHPVDPAIKVDMKNVCEHALFLSHYLPSTVHSLNLFFTVHHGYIDRSILTQANRTIQKRCECGRYRYYPSPSLGPLRQLLSRRATAIPARNHEYILFINHVASRNYCRVELLLWAE